MRTLNDIECQSVNGGLVVGIIFVIEVVEAAIDASTGDATDLNGNGTVGFKNPDA